MSIASSYQLQERDTEALQWAVRHACYGLERLVMERDTHYRRGDGMQCFLPELGESEVCLFFRLRPVDNLVAQRESSRGQIDVYDVLCD